MTGPQRSDTAGQNAVDRLWILDIVEVADQGRSRPESVLLLLEGVFESEAWGTVTVNVVGEDRADVDAGQVQQWGAVLERHDDLLAAAARLVASETGQSVGRLNLGSPALTFWSSPQATEPVEWCVHFYACSAYPEAGVVVNLTGDTPTDLWDPVECDDIG